MTGVAARIDALRASPDGGAELLALLAEQSPAYAGLGSGEAERLRGYAMASFETLGLPDVALPSVMEALETGYAAYSLAAAARALRGAPDPPEDAARILLRAVARLARHDEVVVFDRFDAYFPDPAAGPATTGLTELFRTFAWLGPRARSALGAIEKMRAERRFSPQVRAAIDAAIEAIAAAPELAPSPCCAKAAAPATACTATLDDIELQDQHGATLRFAKAFHGRPTLLAFFYTRCTNAQKCPTTIARLGQLQRLLATEGLAHRINLAAISYDPGYDLPARLLGYGQALGLVFDARARLWRTTGPFEPLRAALDLGVGYGQATVNQHRIELFVLDSRGRVAEAIVRRSWRPEEALVALRGLLEPAGEAA